ncbi:MAG: DUF3817 domain-containing protein [Actinobacteria bacterium]|nr:DUF3817 domain-containing protein [Actinomycetota bacterium]
MVLQPKPSDYPRIRTALKFYKITSIITGTMLLLLCAVMVMKYAFHVQLFLFTPNGFARFEPLPEAGLESNFTPQGFDLFKAILIAHGWFYVLYLISNFMLWSPMRWRFPRFLLLALGGVIPFMSFFLEVRTVREVTTHLDAHERGSDQQSDQQSGDILESSTPATEGTNA